MTKDEQIQDLKDSVFHAYEDYHQMRCRILRAEEVILCLLNGKKELAAHLANEYVQKYGDNK